MIVLMSWSARYGHLVSGTGSGQVKRCLIRAHVIDIRVTQPRSVHFRGALCRGFLVHVLRVYRLSRISGEVLNDLRMSLC